MTTQPTKFCVDCRHYQGAAANDECTSPENSATSPVTGEIAYTWKAALSARSNLSGACGIEARWFEAKEAK